MAPKSASRRIEEYEEEDEFGAKDCTKEIDLKLDHQNRPLWIVKFSFHNFHPFSTNYFVRKRHQTGIYLWKLSHLYINMRTISLSQ